MLFLIPGGVTTICGIVVINFSAYTSLCWVYFTNTLSLRYMFCIFVGNILWTYSQANDCSFPTDFIGSKVHIIMGSSVSLFGKCRLTVCFSAAYNVVMYIIIYLC